MYLGARKMSDRIRTEVHHISRKQIGLVCQYVVLDNRLKAREQLTNHGQQRATAGHRVVIAKKMEKLLLISS